MEQVQLTTEYLFSTRHSRFASRRPGTGEEKGLLLHIPWCMSGHGRRTVSKYILSRCDATWRSTLQPLSEAPARHTGRPMSVSRFLFCRNRTLFAELCSVPGPLKQIYAQGCEAVGWGGLEVGRRYCTGTVLDRAAIVATYSYNREKPWIQCDRESLGSRLLAVWRS